MKLIEGKHQKYLESCSMRLIPAIAVEVFYAAVKFGNIVDVDYSDTGLWIYVLSHKLTMTKNVCFEEILMQI